jgi:hypothetical protein
MASNAFAKPHYCAVVLVVALLSGFASYITWEQQLLIRMHVIRRAKLSGMTLGRRASFTVFSAVFVYSL